VRGRDNKRTSEGEDESGESIKTLKEGNDRAIVETSE
jgi:hypothetical protein